MEHSQTIFSSFPTHQTFRELDHYHWPDPSVVRLLGTKIHRVTEESLIQNIMERIKLGRGGWVATPNLDHLMRATHDHKFKTLCAQANFVVADGMPLVWASRIQGQSLPERVCGSNLMISLSAAAASRNLSIYLLGGMPGTTEQAVETLKRRYPTLRVAGWCSPEVRTEIDPAQVQDLANQLNEAKPDIIFVALGSPKQERLINDLRGLLPRAWWLGVGISFSFLSGHVKRAPRWMQKAGLEWIHRLIQEPQRLTKRYLVQDMPFAIVLFASAFTQRLRNNWFPPRHRPPLTNMGHRRAA